VSREAKPSTVSFDELGSNHLEVVRRWRNSPEVASFMYTDDHITEADQVLWFERVSVDPASRYWVVLLELQPVGLISLTNIDLTNRRCDWAIYLGEQTARGRGVASHAQYFGAIQCFDRLGLEKLCCEAFEFNSSAIELYEKLGFEREGLFADHYVKNGEFANVVVLGLHRSRWISVRAPFDQKYQIPASSRGTEK
jgi:UDP-4-amino-4,6-dideoxy-N-acetyl-beta-L-altrosamine N-acetyltransferase